MKFVAGEPAACVGRTLFTADLHLGIEFELRSRGLRLGLHHLRTAERLTRLLAETKAKRLVIIGDAKHDVYGFETEERKMMAEFVDALPAGEVTVVKGNHDSLLAGVKGLTVEPASGAVIAGCGVCHGHAQPSEEVLAKSVLLTGHQHPCFEFEDSLGKWRIPCWLDCSARKKRVWVFPAFGELAGGRAVNNGKLMGPLFRGFAKPKQAFSLDGDALGKL